MKKIILLQLLLLAGLMGRAQWKPYNIDDSVQVSLPSEYTVTDTLGQTIISSTSPFGNILIIKTPDNPATTPDIEKKRHLEDFYKNYLQKIKASTANAIITGEKDTVINNLRYKDFTMQVDSGSGKQFRDFRIVHVNSATYTFELLYNDVHKEYAAGEKNDFFNSIRIPPDATLQNQFTQPENTTGVPPSSNKTNYILAIAAGLVILVIIWLIVRRRKH